MNNAKEYRSAIDSLHFTDGQKAALATALTRRTAYAPTRRRPVLRAALIAAAACILLTGTTFAVTALTNPGIIKFFGGEAPSEPLCTGYTVTNQVKKFPLSAFSAQILAEDAAFVPFGTWEEAESFVGFDLMDNDYLARAEPRLSSVLMEDGTSPHAYVTKAGSGDSLTSASVSAAYQITVNGYPVLIDVWAHVFTELSPEDADTSLMTVSFMEEAAVEVTELTGQNGLTVSIAAMPYEAVPNFYSAYFAVNGVRFIIDAQYKYQGTTDTLPAGNAAAEAALKAVIDSFVF